MCIKALAMYSSQPYFGQKRLAALMSLTTHLLCLDTLLNLVFCHSNLMYSYYIRSIKKIDVVVDAAPPVTDRYTHDSKLPTLISCLNRTSTPFSREH